MTVRELYNWCKACKHKEAEVYLCKDWEQVDDEGRLTDLYRLDNITTQATILDDGFDFIDVHEVILEFDNVQAGSCVDGVIR